MSSLRAKWTPLAGSQAGKPLSTALIRSSHGLAVASSAVYVFGGELQPRTPVDADLLKISLAAAWPAKRVGASLVAAGDSLYLWGGRGGKSMGVFDADEEDLWRFNTTGSQTWEMLKTKGDKPEQRSFHVLSVSNDQKTLYLHAGCPPKGRLATLHSLDLASLNWTSLASAPEPGRGGTNLAPLPSSNLLARFGGFAGYELGGFDLYDPAKDSWESVDIAVEGGGEGPDKRSVASLQGVESGIEWNGKKVIALLALGEREGAPAELGHDGAGFFHDDAWALLATTSTPTTYSWLKLEPSSSSTVLPEARGWLPSASWGDKVVLQGGLNAKNERLGDGWVLEVVQE
ncbi:hypothetical protein BCR35DRAFT_265912 [Leucosporidium creatinivorum]|uniref:Kelch repeat protein n=1 Tax=Leucosporidium creatinivorum TaxID=106004 RepID=A0A1Y2FBB6_9BASI|nr:hypothetical protein BCR35DRAFT_265912 [Leucosporidium creatinivorum]